MATSFNIPQFGSGNPPGITAGRMQAIWTFLKAIAQGGAGSVVKADSAVQADNGIVESGSNANGRWVKFGDGTMICDGSIMLDTSGQSVVQSFRGAFNCLRVGGTWNYPANFYSVPRIFHGDFYGGAGISSAPSLGGVAMFVERVSQVSSPIYILAIGRWKA